MVSEAYEITFLSVCLITVSALNPASFFTRERTPVPIEQEAGWASDLVWTQRLEEETFASAGIKPRQSSP
jgi:hypothetical protein